MVIAQISDLHVTSAGMRARGVDTAVTLASCVEHIGTLDPQPDLVLATGDLTEEGTPNQYLRLRELLAPLRAPVYVIPGNHDERRALRAAFADHTCVGSGDGPIDYVINSFNLGLIALDTTTPGADGGALTASQLAWFDGALAEMAERPVLVFMHHPPIATGIRYMDEIALDASSTAALGAIVARRPRIERIVCGHVHRNVQARWHGTVVSICPSTAFQCALNLRDESFDADAAEPPAYQLHYWNGTELVTHTVSVALK